MTQNKKTRSNDKVMILGTIGLLLLVALLFAFAPSQNEDLPSSPVATAGSDTNDHGSTPSRALSSPDMVAGEQTPRPNIASPSMNFDIMRAPEGYKAPSTQPTIDWQNAYLNRHPRLDSYWLTGQEQSNQLKQMQVEETKIRAQAERLRGLLLRYKDTSELSRRIFSNFNNFRLSVFANGVSRNLVTVAGASNGDVQAALKQLQGLEVCYIPGNQIGHRSLIANNCYYRKEWGAVMMRATNMPNEIEIALFYHELGHALRHRVDRAPSAMAPSHTDEFIWEEAEMHVLELEVMDAVTNGQFTALLDSIIDRTTPNPPGHFSPRIYDTLNNVRASDLAAYDRLFKLTDTGQSVTSVAVAQFKLSLLFRITDRFAPPETRKEVKTNLYRWVAGIPRQPQRH